jgi:hypothetical protein
LRRADFSWIVSPPIRYALLLSSARLSSSAFLACGLRPGQIAAPLLSIIPWILDVLTLDLAWKAIGQTGIQPDPPRLMVAAVVIFLYTSLLPAPVLVLKYFHH